MKLRLAVVLVPLLMASCDRRAIDLRDPSEKQVDEALEAFSKMTPQIRTGRWEVVVSNTAATTEVDQATAEKLRAATSAWNTEAKCRQESNPLDAYTKGHIKASLRPGCKIERLSADPGAISWASTCEVARYKQREEVDIHLDTERSTVSMRTESEERRDAGPLTLKSDGRFVGQCHGDETSLYPLWIERQ
jgi:hypothetical protein